MFWLHSWPYYHSNSVLEYVHETSDGYAGIVHFSICHFSVQKILELPILIAVQLHILQGMTGLEKEQITYLSPKNYIYLNLIFKIFCLFQFSLSFCQNDKIETLDLLSN